jgi:hypothetical protein
MALSRINAVDLNIPHGWLILGAELSEKGRRSVGWAPPHRDAGLNSENDFDNDRFASIR